MKKITFKIWMKPFDTRLWVFMLFLTIILYTLNLPKKYTALDIFGVLLRQDPEARDKNMIFLTFSIFNIVFLGLYEFYITSELIVPVVKTPFTTLEQFVAHDYKFLIRVFIEKKGMNVSTIQQQVENDFKNDS